MTIHTLAVNYPLVNIQETMENHHFQWVNPLFLWPFSMSQTVGLPEGTLFRQKTKCLLGNTSHKKSPENQFRLCFFSSRCFSTMFGMVPASLLAKDFPFGSHLLEQFVIFAWLSQWNHYVCMVFAWLIQLISATSMARKKNGPGRWSLRDCGGARAARRSVHEANEPTNKKQV